MFQLACPELVIEDEVSKGHTRADIASTYGLALRAHAAGTKVDWTRINTAILTRFKPSGLAWIKERAWALYEGRVKP